MSGRLRLWLERGESGYWLRDAATGDPVRWSDPRLLVLPVAGASYRLEALADPAFAPPAELALVPEPENEHDPNAIGDPIYFNDPQARAFVRLDPALYERIEKGQVRL